MTRPDAINLNYAFMNQALKVKFLTGPSYAILIEFKRSLSRYITEMAEKEKTLAEDYKEVKVVDGQFDTKDESFLNKLKEIQKKEFTHGEMNFMSLDEFKKFTDEVDFNTGTVLSEFILKKPL